MSTHIKVIKHRKRADVFLENEVFIHGKPGCYDVNQARGFNHFENNHTVAILTRNIETLAEAMETALDWIHTLKASNRRA